ncbi:hypothetical protein [Streptomyces violascens]|uniref:hypothetical protein n=1 Tax=Streptomyces violascens TaxID=67381 RepID=UPI0036878590
MARPMNPLPASSNPLVAFAHDLRALRDGADRPTLQEMSLRCGVSTASLSKAQSGHTQPTWNAVRGYVQACGGDISYWHDRWHRLRLVGDADVPQASLEPRLECLARWVTTGKILPPPVDTADQLREALHWLLKFYDLSLRDLAAKAPTYSHSSYHAVLTGRRPITPALLRALLLGCGVQSMPSVEAWLRALGRTGSDDLTAEIFQFIEATRRATAQQEDRAHKSNIRGLLTALNRAVQLVLKGDGSRTVQDYRQLHEVQRQILLALSRDVLRSQHVLPDGSIIDPQSLSPYLRGRQAIPEPYLAHLVNSLAHADYQFRREVFQGLLQSSQVLARGLRHWMVAPRVAPGQLAMFPVAGPDNGALFDWPADRAA